MNRYGSWLMWRFAQDLRGSWRVRLATLLAFLTLLMFHGAVLGLSSPSVVQTVAKWLAPDVSPASPSQHVSTPFPSSSSPPLVDPLAPPASVEEVRRALADFTSRPDWLVHLENHRLVRAGTRVHVSASHALSDRQRRLLQVQGMTLVEWSDPGKEDRLTPAPEFWIQRTTASGWVIHARPMDVSPAETQGPGELVVLRAILWIDALDALEQWRAAHPAPTPPEALSPTGVDVLLLPSTTSNQMMALAASWLGLLLLMSAVALSQLSAWERRRAAGLWVPLAGLSHKTHPWLVVQSLLVVLPLFLGSVLSGLVVWSVYRLMGYGVATDWLWRLPVMVAVSAWWIYAFSGLIGVLPRLWSRFLAISWVLLLSGGTLWMSERWMWLRPISKWFVSFPGIGLLFFFVASTLLVIRLTAWWLDRHARRGYQAT